jgi:hypothetical protein
LLKGFDLTISAIPPKEGSHRYQFSIVAKINQQLKFCAGSHHLDSKIRDELMGLEKIMKKDSKCVLIFLELISIFNILSRASKLDQKTLTHINGHI